MYAIRSYYALEVAQDRLTEKRFAAESGGTTAPFHAVDTTEDLSAALAEIGSPGILKTRREGYDGKGQWRIMADSDARHVTVGGGSLLYEGFVRFFAEFSVILCRGQDGRISYNFV